MKKLKWKLAKLGTAVLVCASAFVATSLSQAQAASTSKPTGTITVAYPPDGIPNYIFPELPGASDTVPDIFEFIDQFWRPLYWFGNDGGSSVDPSLSLAYPPTYSNGGKTVTIKLKDWKWSDGDSVTSRDVEFWINVLKNNRDGFANYIPGGFPDNVTNFDYISPTTFSLTFNKAYNHNWLLENQLSLITAIPQHAWDKTSATGKIGNYDLTASGAQAVYKFLNTQSLDVDTYTNNPLWQVVDGPYRLESYQPNSEVTMVPNTAYSGPVKSHVAKIEFLNFTSDAAEYLQVLAGKIDYGYIPFSDIPAESQVKAQGYKVDVWPLGGMSYVMYNYTNPKAGPLFKQLYIRQAIQSVIDQPAYVQKALYGLGVVDYGPVPKFEYQQVFNGKTESDAAEQDNLYPYSISNAKKLLKDHGWKIVPDGTDTCQKSGTASNECGAGIVKGEPLTFQLMYPSGVIQYATEFQALASSASQAGIDVVQRLNTNAETYALTSPCTKGKPCLWQAMTYYIGGWQYGTPINYPTPPLVFACGSIFAGGYCSPELDKLMLNAETANSVTSLYAYEDYAAKNLPVMWIPLQPFQISAVKDGLTGVDPQNNQGTITPEFWKLKS